MRLTLALVATLVTMVVAGLVPACGRGRGGGTDGVLGRVRAVMVSEGVDAAVAELVGACRGGEADFWEAKNLGHELLDAGDASGARFALVVLEAGRVMEDELDVGATMELAWWTVGRLAFKAADAEAASGDWVAAERVMLAGPERWRRDSYWRKYPDHDALIAVVLASQGRRAEAIRWLDQRAVLMPPADEVYEALRGG